MADLLHRLASRGGVAVLLTALACGAPGPPGPQAQGPLRPGIQGAAPIVGVPEVDADAPSFVPDEPLPESSGPLVDFEPSLELVVAADGSGDFKDLAEAVRAAPSGARILIRRGTYTGSMVLNRPVVLQAEGPRPTIIGTDGPTFTVRTEQVALRDLVVKAPPTAEVLLVERGAVEMERCALVGGEGDGLVLAGPGTSLRMLRSALASTGKTGLRVRAGSEADLFDSEIARCTTGVLVEGGQFRWRESRVAYCGTGLLVDGPGGCELRGGFFWSNGVEGVRLQGGAVADLKAVTIRAPGGLPGVVVTDRSQGVFESCTIMGTPMEADHHIGGMTRDHIATELRDGTDHHILTGLVTVEDHSEPVFRRCLIVNSLGHGLLVRDAGGLFEESEIVGSVFYNVFLADEATPVFRRCYVRNAGENGVFSWLGSAGLFEHCTLEANGSYTEDRNRWAQVVLADGATTRFVDSLLVDGGGAGFVSSGLETTGELLRCEVTGNGGVGVSVAAGGDPRVHHTVIADNGGDGLWMTRGGLGDIQDVVVRSNGGLGARIDQYAAPRLSRCQLLQNAEGGLLVRRSAAPRISESSVTANEGAGLVVDYGGRAWLSDCTIADNQGDGVLVEAPGHAELVDCDVEDNRDGQTVVRDGAELVIGP